MISASSPLPASSLQSFLEQLRKLVLDEAITTRQQKQQIWTKSLAARVAGGRAIEAVRIERVRPDGRIECTCPRNHSRFREGDILCLNRHSPFFYPNFMVTLEIDDEETLILNADVMDANWGDIPAGSDGWILDEGYLDLSHHILSALDEVGDSLVGRSRILPLLMRQASPRLDPARYTRGLEMGEAVDLNWSQCEALAGAYAANLAYLVQGPPGTGKTWVLAYLAQALAGDGERVLVTAFTHRAINNALNKIAEVLPGTPVIKIGEPSRADDLRVENYATFNESPLSDSADGYIIGATPFAPHSQRLMGVEFDTVIFDESSQITLPLAIMGMLPAQRYIFFGDQHQLPPVLVTRPGSNQLRDSVFSVLAGHDFEAMLAETYRLSRELVAWPNKHFYEGRLVPVPAAVSRRVHYPRPPARLDHILDPESPKVFWDMGQSNTRTHSYREADAVTDLILTLLQTGFPAAEIGVIAPYRAQGRAIRARLRRHIQEPSVRRQIVVDTVERMQGQERDVIILSLTTSSPAFAADLADFFFQPERLNVAVTRARRKLIIVGSRQVLQAAPGAPEQQESVELLRDLLDSCVTIPYGV